MGFPFSSATLPFRERVCAKICTQSAKRHTRSVNSFLMGHPIACDELYGDGRPILLSSIKHNFKLSKKEEEERPILNRLALHSHKLTFTGPDKKIHEFEAPVPKDLKATLQQLAKRKSGRHSSI